MFALFRKKKTPHQNTHTHTHTHDILKISFYEVRYIDIGIATT